MTAIVQAPLSYRLSTCYSGFGAQFDIQSKASGAAADLGGQLPDESCVHLQRQLPPEVELRAERLGLEGGLKRRNGQLQLVIGRKQGQTHKGVGTQLLGPA